MENEKHSDVRMSDIAMEGGSSKWVWSSDPYDVGLLPKNSEKNPPVPGDLRRRNFNATMNFY